MDHEQCKVSPGGEKSRVFTVQLPITEGLRGQLCLTALTIIFKMFLTANHHDDSLAVGAGSTKDRQAVLSHNDGHLMGCILFSKP